MRQVADVNTVAGQDEAMIIFLRTGVRDDHVPASVFEVPEHGPARLIASFANGNKMVHTTAPGHHTFMVVGGGSTGFMAADLQPAKVYFVRVTLLLDKWREFSLQPIRGAERAQFPSWLADAIWVETTHESLTWANDNAADIEQRRAAHLPTWLGKPADQRTTLRPEDGR
jgi:hypothetical protein